MIIGVDPGYRTGVCVLNNIQSGDQFSVFTSIEVEWPQRLSFFAVLLRNHRNAILEIVIERYVLFGYEDAIKTQINSEMPAARVIGVIEGIAECCGLTSKLVFQEPRDRRQVGIIPEHRDQVGLSRHNQDAYRHARFRIKQREALALIGS